MKTIYLAFTLFLLDGCFFMGENEERLDYSVTDSSDQSEEKTLPLIMKKFLIVYFANGI